MESLFNINGLMFWDEREIHLRRSMEAYFERELKKILLNMNPAWKFYYIEAPLLNPKDLINKNYTNSDVWMQSIADSDWANLFLEFHKFIQNENNVEKLKPRLFEYTKENHMGDREDTYDNLLYDLEKLRKIKSDEMPTGKPARNEVFDIWLQFTNQVPRDLVLRPETTPSSYAYACHLLENKLTNPPFVVWQAGKSFRREQDQVTKNMRLKEFYQQEFQCIFTSDTFNDYQEQCLEPVRKMLSEQVHLPTRLVESDRLPSYSLRTMDVEVNNGDKWMEICSISKRTDFPMKAQFQAKGKAIEKDLLVLEVAIGLDRMVYNWSELIKKC